MFYYTHTEKARINQISPGQQHKSSHNSKSAPDTSIKARISQKQPGTMTINCAV